MESTQIQLPSAGRIVHLFHNGKDEDAAKNGAEFVPAIVTQSWGGYKSNLQIFFNETDPNLPCSKMRWSVDHKSEAHEGSPYWDWPAKV